MNKSDLKKLIKPVVKECIHEVLIEEGLLSNIVSEVAKGMQGNVITETRRPKQTPNHDNRMKQKAVQTNTKLREHRKKLMDSIGNEAYNGVNLFEGTEPMRHRDSGPAQGGSVDLGSPGDAGVDISSLMGDAAKIWRAMK
jgi:hypothetical protein